MWYHININQKGFNVVHFLCGGPILQGVCTMKKIAKIGMVVASFVAAASMVVSCAAAETVGTVLKTFGEFAYGVHTLTEIAKNTITASEARQIVGDNQAKLVVEAESGVITSADETTDDDSEVTAPAEDEKDESAEGDDVNVNLPVVDDGMVEIKPCEEMINVLKNKFGGVNVKTKYYVEGSDVQQVKTDEIKGDDFLAFVNENKFSPFNQLTARYLYAYEELIDFMSEENKKFDSSSAPFNAPFTYHVDSNGNFIIQTHYFTGIASSVSGGISCYYQQDTEILYDAQNKISRWQSSLGVILSTPNGSVHQGYILEMEFDWVEKA